MMDKRILVIDDDPDLVSLLEHAFSREGADVYAAYDGREGLRRFYDVRPDLVILDVIMPILDGWQTLARIRDLSDVPVIMLTIQGSEDEIVRGLEAGAVDYVTKPFSIRVLQARAQAALRVADSPPRLESLASYDDGYLEVDLFARRVLVRGEPVRLTGTEYRLLAYLVENAGHVQSQRQILEHVWGPEYGGESQYVRAYVGRLRRKVEVDPSNPRYLRNVRGVGYCFEAQAQGWQTE